MNTTHTISRNSVGDTSSTEQQQAAGARQNGAHVIDRPAGRSARIPTTSKSVSAARSRVTRRRAITVGLCDLTRGELSSNGTPEQRQAEAAARRAGARRALAREPRLARRRHRDDAAELIRSAVDIIRRHRPRAIAIPHWDDRHPDHVAASHVLRVAAFRSGLRRYDTDARSVAARLGLLLLHQRRRDAVVRRRRLGRTTSASARRSPATRSQFAPVERRRRADTR
mgnify:CR=1 FL=1